MNGYSKAQEVYDNQTPYDDECDEYCECVACAINDYMEEEE